MTDRMFGSDGGSAYLGRHEPVDRVDRRPAGRPHPVAQDGEEAPAAVARRLQSRVDHHLWLLGRMRADPLQSEPSGVTDLLETARRMRRDTESLLLLCGQDAGDHTGGRRRLSDVLHDAAAAAEEPRHIDVRPAPAANVAPRAATELHHVLAELLDHVTAVYPGARVDVACRVEAPGGIAVELRADGAARHDPDGFGGRQAMAVAQRLVHRSRSGIALRTPAAGLGSTGPVASIHCPGTAVTVEEPARNPWVDEPRWPDPALSGTPRANGVGSGSPVRRGYVPTAQVDELFGPLLDITPDALDGIIATPIFEAVASAWFRNGDPEPGGAGDGDHSAGSTAGGGAGDPLDWETPSDSEWRAAAARAARPEPVSLPGTDLPRRRPGEQLVPPPLAKAAAQDHGSAAARVPDRVRDRLSTYQRGLRQGRHRAGPPEEPDQNDPAGL